jgi:hypothetical protein
MVDNSEITVKQRGFKYQIWLMLFIVAGVILAGFVIVPKTEEQRQQMIDLLGTTNIGELVKPALDFSSILDDLPVTDKPKWKVVTVGGIGCSQTCEDMLFSGRQVHMLMGSMTGRVERVYLPDVASVDPLKMDELRALHLFLTIMPTSPKLVAQIIAGSSADWDMQEPRSFVVTPDHKAVLYYTKDHDGSGLLDDLKHLLKYSPDR